MVFMIIALDLVIPSCLSCNSSSAAVVNSLVCGFVFRNMLPTMFVWVLFLFSGISYPLCSPRCYPLCLRVCAVFEGVLCKEW